MMDRCPLCDYPLVMSVEGDSRATCFNVNEMVRIGRTKQPHFEWYLSEWYNDAFCIYSDNFDFRYGIKDKLVSGIIVKNDGNEGFEMSMNFSSVEELKTFYDRFEDNLLFI